MSYKNYEKYGISQQQFQQIKHYFELLDSNKQGKIRPEDIKTLLQNIGQETKNSTIYQHICTLCSEGKGQLQFDQFLPLMTSKILKKQPTLHASELIQLLDDEKRGFITIQTLRRVVKQLNIEADEQTLQQMLKLADQNKDQMISIQQLQNLLYWIEQKNK